ncbi:MAG TPA: patatin-like phospholipase family protein [Blastocatellia bacterium]|nr:patatin-like phospholipase family protein [Blastocatellia bacterium]
MTEQKEQPPLPLYEVLEEEYVSLHGPLPGSHYEKSSEERLKEIYKHIHALEKKRAAICISGGGIRSATFALGVMQRLARLNLLQEFDYLSTVSGGGYVGSWLSAWIHRDPKGAGGVFGKLNNKLPSPLEPEGKLPSPLEPEAKPIQHLRSYSNYLSPQLGLLSADTWTLVAIITRNLILNWTIFLPLMIAALIVPRLFASFIRINLPETTKDVVLTILLLLALICGVIAVAYMGVFRPSLKKYRKKKWESFEGQGWFLWLCLVPTLLLVLLLCVYWAWLRNSSKTIEAQTSPVLGIHIEYPWAFMLIGVLLPFTAWLFQSALLRRFKSWWEPVVALGVGFAGGAFLWFASQIFPQPTYDGDTWIPVTEYFVCFAIPLLLVFMLLAVTLFVGFALPLTDEDREWLARYGAWILIAALGWAVISWLVIFGPHWLMKAPLAVQSAIAAAGGISGVLVATLGRSASTAANDTQKAEGKQSSLKDIALKLAAPVLY